MHVSVLIALLIPAFILWGCSSAGQAVTVVVNAPYLVVTLADGHIIQASLVWFPRLEQATASQRFNWRLLGEGAGIHWPGINEASSVLGFLGVSD